VFHHIRCFIEGTRTEAIGSVQRHHLSDKPQMIRHFLVAHVSPHRSIRIDEVNLRYTFKDGRRSQLTMRI
jgi:hypothetical protein